MKRSTIAPSASSSGGRLPREKRRKAEFARQVEEVRQESLARARALYGSKRKKKRRKKRLPRSPRPLLRDRAHRRLRQWLVPGWSFWCCSSRCVPFWRRLAHDAPHHGRYGPEGQLQWYCKAGIADDSAPRAVFPSLSSGPRCSASWPTMWPTSSLCMSGRFHRCRS